MQALCRTTHSSKMSITSHLTLKAVAIILALIATMLVVTSAAAYRTELPKPAPILKGYQLDGQPLRIVGLADNASGLTYSAHNNTLFMVVNNPEQIYELSLFGDVLRVIDLNGFEDTEGIAHIEGNRFAVLEERRSEISFITIDNNTRQLEKSRADHFALNIFNGSKKNSRLEGISIDHTNGDIYLVKEKSPRALYKVSGLLNGGKNVGVTSPWDLEKDSSGMSDLSGLFFAADPDRLLVLSHESFKLAEFSLSGQPISEVKLNSSRQAQFKNIPQAEGVTITADGTLFIVSEPNLLYRYVRSEKVAEKTDPSVHHSSNG